MTTTPKSAVVDKRSVAAQFDYDMAGYRLSIVLMIVYFWWIIWTPYIRFPILGDIYFEKLLAAAWLISILMQSSRPRLASSFTTLLLLQFSVLLVLSWITWVPPSLSSTLWQQNYWKKLLFFVMAVLSIRDRKDLFHAMVGIVIVVYGYQLLSWRDFLAGGSYVYQQGMKRMIGMWVENSYGAGNYWGSLSAFAIPFAIYGYRRASRPWMKYAVTPLVLLLVFSVIFSGSRGSLVSMLAYMVFAFGAKLWRPKYVLAALAIAVIAISFVPEEYKNRYSMIFVDKEDIHTGSQSEQIAKASAASRIQGLVDGWNIMLKHPQGSGPGSSQIARLEVNKEMANSGQILQTHNLYGQVFGEAGVIGSLLIFLMWYRMYRFLSQRSDSETLAVEKDAILGALVVMLVYGMASHSLYSDWWIWLYVFTVSIFNIGQADALRVGAASYRQRIIPTET